MLRDNEIKYEKDGSFSINELVNLYRNYENSDSIMSLAKETAYFEELLKKEDWEIERSILDFILHMEAKTK